jgi:hypothetical protein
MGSKLKQIQSNCSKNHESNSNNNNNNNSNNVKLNNNYSPLQPSSSLYNNSNNNNNNPTSIIRIPQEIKTNMSNIEMKQEKVILSPIISIPVNTPEPNAQSKEVKSTNNNNSDLNKLPSEMNEDKKFTFLKEDNNKQQQDNPSSVDYSIGTGVNTNRAKPLLSETLKTLSAQVKMMEEEKDESQLTKPPITNDSVNKIEISPPNNDNNNISKDLNKKQTTTVDTNTDKHHRWGI